MLNDASSFTHIYLCTGYTNLRKGIDGLVAIVKGELGLDPAETGCMFLFCGRRGDRFKALLWEGNGFLLLYKRLEHGSLSWPRTPDEVASLSKHEYRLLLQGLNPVQPRVREVNPKTAF